MFFPIGKKTKFENKYIKAVGRALCISQNFESNCRSLAILLDIKEYDQKISKQIEFSNLIKRLSKRMLSNSIKRFSKNIPLPESIMQILENGKNSRNYIAHDSMKALFETLDIDERLSVQLVALRDDVRNLAIADGMVATWCSGISENKSDSRKSYAEDVEKWVFHEFTPEDF